MTDDNATRPEGDSLRDMVRALRLMHTPDLTPKGPLPSGYTLGGERDPRRICRACEVWWWPCPTIEAMAEFPDAADIIGPLPKNGELPG